MPDTVLKIHDILVVLLSWASQTLLALYWALVRCAIASSEQSLLVVLAADERSSARIDG
jgi:hypothetical protein